MAKIVGIKFNKSNKTYYFSPNGFDLSMGQGVVVETARGVEFGKVVLAEKEVDDKKINQPLKPIIRIATDRDLEIVEKNKNKEKSAIKLAEEKVQKRGLKMDIIDCDFTLDESKVIFSFTADDRVDFRELVKDLASLFHIRIELKQVGIRDEAKLLGGIAMCGRECCCSSYLPDFKKSTVKMAKTQGLSLNPTNISGLCGRLMCCLEYENPTYSENFKKMPKQGGTVKTPDGEGTVVSNNILKLQSKVKITQADGTIVYKDFSVDELKFKQNDKEDKKEKIDDSLKELQD